jgi:AcrR family transcriptional regulator
LTGSGGKRQQRAAATAEQLLTAARRVFEDRGYAGTSVGAITQEANTAHGTFYLYFKNKEDAFAKVMADVAAEINREANASWAGDVRSTLASAIRGYLDVYRSHLGLWRCLLEGMHQSKAVETMWLDVRRPFVDRIEQNIQLLLDGGEIRPIDPKVAAHALASMTEWFAFTHFELGEPSVDEVPLDRAVDTLSDLWYAGVYAGGAHWQ